VSYGGRFLCAAFEEPEDPAGKSYFSEIIASVSDLEFTRDGRYIVSRDYLSIKVRARPRADVRSLPLSCYLPRRFRGMPCLTCYFLLRLCVHRLSPPSQVWDLAMESRPLRVIPVHEFLRPKLVELYESDCIFDKFEVSTAGSDGSSVMTGSYSNCFKVYDAALGSETTIELAKGKPKQPQIRPIVGGVGVPSALPGGQNLPAGADVNEVAMAEAGALRAPFDPSIPPIDPDEIDFSRKVLHFSWHPHEDIVAVAGLNNLYIYHA